MKNIFYFFLAGILAINLPACKTTSNNNQVINKDDFIKWIIKDSKDYPYVSKKFFHIDDLASLRLTIKQHPGLESSDIDVLSEKLTHKDSIYLNKSIAMQRDTINEGLLSGKNYLENAPAFNAYPYREARFIRISDPIYLPKEKLYIIVVENVCGGRCGEGNIKAYRKTEKGFELVKYFMTWIS
jgi:hypothetical protein